MNPEDLKREIENWKKQWQITILVKEYSIKWIKYNLFKITIEDKP